MDHFFSSSFGHPGMTLPHFTAISSDELARSKTGPHPGRICLPQELTSSASLESIGKCWGHVTSQKLRTTIHKSREMSAAKCGSYASTEGWLQRACRGSNGCKAEALSQVHREEYVPLRTELHVEAPVRSISRFVPDHALSPAVARACRRGLLHRVSLGSTPPPSPRFAPSPALDPLCTY